MSDDCLKFEKKSMVETKPQRITLPTAKSPSARCFGLSAHNFNLFYDDIHSDEAAVLYLSGTKKAHKHN